MVAVAALCNPEGGSLEEASRLEPEWNLPTWEDIVRVHSARVYRLAYRLTGNVPDAEDLTQEVFVRVFRSLSNYTPGTFEGWLHRITTNLFLDMVRRRQRIRFDALPEDAPERLASAEAGPERAYEENNLDPEIQRLLEEAETLTKDNCGLTLVVAFNYGGRQEIARAVQRIAEEVSQHRRAPEEVTADLITQYLDAPDLPDPDLVIRTSGEQRLSNFLLWQAAYSEFVFLPIYWPDFDRAALEQAIGEYRRRERRFGGLVARTGS